MKAEQFQNQVLIRLICRLTLLLTAANLWLLAGGQSLNGAEHKRPEKPLACGNYTIDKGSLNSALQFEKTHQRPAAAAIVVRLYFHICRDGLGTNAGATISQVTDEYNQMIADYAPANICFVSMGIDYIDNTALNNTPTALSLGPWVVPNAINVFFHAAIPGAGGNAWSIPNTFCSIARGNLGAARTTSHEVGHCLGLLHTFEPAYGYERINGTNSSTSADLITDTQADPWAYSGASCFSAPGCAYTGTCTDPLGATNFSPPYSNIMAYWQVTRTNCNLGTLTFTNAQFSRIFSFLTNNTNLANCTVTNSTWTVSNATYSAGYNWLTAINSVNTSGNVLMTGNGTTTMSANIVVISPGFMATPGSGGLLLIRPTACTIGSAVPRIPFAANNEESTQSDVSIYPNPFSKTFVVSLPAASADKVRVTIYNSLGTQVQTLPAVIVTKGLNKISINGSAFARGIYLVEILVNDKKTVRKIVKI